MTDRKRFAAEMKQRQHEAEQALVAGNAEPRRRMWSHRDPVTLFAALGPSKSGWQELEPMLRSVASRVSGGHDVTYELVACDAADEIGWTIGFSRFTVSIDGGPATRYTLRLTHLYRKENGEWKVVHEHSDFQPGDHPMPPPVEAAERPDARIA
jgi:ketosteroid isomerase-like protein